jgi:hypothetical protein
MLSVNNLTGFGSGVAGGASLTFVDSTGSDTESRNYTFSGHAIGDASDDRTVFVEVLTIGDPSLAVSSLTIGGSGAAKAVALPGANHESEIWYLDVASGTTADIIVNYPGSPAAVQVGCLIGVWASTGIDSGSGPTATGTSTASPGSISIAIPAGGILLSCTAINNPTTGFTWANITEGFEGIVSTKYGNWYGSGAGILDVAGSTPTITVTYTSSAGSTRVMCAAAFGPS